MNTTTISSNTIMNVFSNGPPPSWAGTVIYLMLFVFIPIAFTIVGFAVLWNVASYTRFKKYLENFADSFRYALLGLITCIVLAIPMGVVYWGFMQAKAGNTVPLIYSVYIISAYIIFAIIGWVVNKYIIERVQRFEKELDKGDKKPMKN